MNQVRTPRQRRGIETKKQIIGAAFKLFAAKGIHGTNSKEIAKKAGVSIGSFYSYFKNKKVLLLEMLEDYVERHYKMIWETLYSLDGNDLGRDGIKSMIEGVFRAYDISPEFHRQTHALRYSDPDIMRIYHRERERELNQIRHLIQRNFAHIPLLSDPDAAAMIIHNAVENVAHTLKFTGTEISEERLVEGLADMIAGFMKIPTE